jgi:hypothetical protein
MLYPARPWRRSTASWGHPAQPIGSSGRRRPRSLRRCATEADHLVLNRLGIDAELALQDDLAVTYNVQTLDTNSLKAARKLYGAIPRSCGCV